MLSFLKKWSLAIWKNKLCRRLIIRRDNQSLRNLMFFLVKYDYPFPMYNAKIQNALFSINSWDMEYKYQEILLSEIQNYLFNNIEKSQEHEWFIWLKYSRKVKHPIDVTDFDIASSLWRALQLRKLNMLSKNQEEREYLYSLYRDSYVTTLEQAGLVNDRKVLVPLMKFAACPPSSLQIEHHEWLLSEYELYLCRRFLKQKDSQRFNDLIHYMIDHNRRSPFDNPDIRNLIFQVDYWELNVVYTDGLFSCMEAYLFDNIGTTYKEEWHAWLKLARKLNHQIDVVNPKIVQGLWNTYCAGKLARLPKEDYIYLYTLYGNSYQTILNQAKVANGPKVFPTLLKFAVISLSLHPKDHLEWFINEYETRLCKLLCRHKNTLFLIELVAYALSHNRSLPINITEVREALFAVDSWPTERKYQAQLLSEIEFYFVHNVALSQKHEWRIWLERCRELNHHIDLSNPDIANAFLSARAANKLADVKSKDYKYVLRFHLFAYDLFQQMKAAEQTEILHQCWKFGPINDPNIMPEWLLLSFEKLLYRHLIEKKDTPALRNIVDFLIEHKRSFHIDDSAVRNVLFSIDTLRLEGTGKEWFLSEVQNYLFNNIDKSQTHEWRFWLKWCREVKYYIDMVNPNIIKVFSTARNAGRLIDISFEDIDYIFRPYLQLYESFQEIKPEDQTAILCLFWAVGPIDAHVNVSTWILSEYENILYTRLIEMHNNQALAELVFFLAKYNRSFDSNNSKARDALFKVKSWQIPEEYKDYQSYLFFWAEEYLFDLNNSVQANEWRVWLNAARTLKHQVDVMDPRVAQALGNAFKFNNFHTEDYEYLYIPCMKAWKQMLVNVRGSHEQEELIPIFLAYGTLAQEFGINEDSQEVFRYWSMNRAVRPRALLAMDDELACHAPIRGIGSPHGIVITFHEDPSRKPVSISCAGSTGDLTLNLKLFTALFARALTCELQSTLVMSNGSTLSIAPQDNDEKMNWLVTGINIEGGSILDDNDKQILNVLAGSLLKDLEQSGLVQLRNYTGAGERERLTKKIIDILKQKNDGIHIIESNSNVVNEAGVVHVIPFLYRDADGIVRPIEIEIPCAYLGADEVFKILHNARSENIQQLINAGRQRQSILRKAFHDQRKRIRWWESLSDEDKANQCTQLRTISVAQSYDSDLGIFVRLEPPEEIERSKYENEDSPRLCDALERDISRYETLCNKLEKIDAPNGEADKLTFKFLVDAMIRQAPVLITRPKEFINEYKEWVALRSGLVWAAIENWVIQRGLSSQVLARDNILFDVDYTTDLTSVIIRPVIMVDIHDFLVRVDCTNGLLEVISGANTPTLLEVLDAKQKKKIDDLKTLHGQFSMRVEEISWVRDMTKPIEGKPEQEKPSHSQTDTLLGLFKVRHLLLLGATNKAIKLVDALSKSYFSPVYFWRAFTYQYRFLEAKVTDPKRISEDTYSQAFNKAPFHSILRILQEYLSYAQNNSPVPSDLDLPITGEAMMVLDELKSKDELYMKRISTISVDELFGAETLDLSPDSETQFWDAYYANTSNEFLYTALAMKEAAKSLVHPDRYENATKEKVIRENTDVVFKIIEMVDELTQNSLAQEQIPTWIKVLNRAQ